LTVCPDPPEIAAVIDFEGGGRMIANVTDTDYRQLKVGDAMEMTFRRLYEAGGIHNYFWKARKA
ncbi:MAG: OB-fold domain-containing protein, partial [Candidatus Methylomirabilis sp.]|nr:OB-fold domain-containing protein [Deltaproteobacteria bacterium]